MPASSSSSVRSEKASEVLSCRRLLAMEAAEGSSGSGEASPAEGGGGGALPGDSLSLPLSSSDMSFASSEALQSDTSELLSVRPHPCPGPGPGPGPGRSAPAAGSAPRHRPFALAAPRPAAPPLPPPRAAAAAARCRFSGRGSLPPPARRGCPEPPPADSLEAAAECAEPPRRLLASDQPGTSLGRAGDGARCSFFFSGSGGGGGPGEHGSAEAASMSPLRCAALGPGCGCGCRPAPPAPHCRAGTRAGGEQKAAEGGAGGAWPMLAATATPPSGRAASASPRVNVRELWGRSPSMRAVPPGASSAARILEASP